MIGVDQRRTVRISPAFGIEMKTNDKIRMQFRVHENRAAADLAVAVKQNLALKFNRAFLLRIFWIQNVVARTRHAVFDQNFSGELIEIGWALRRYRLGAVAYEQHRCAKFS